MDTKKFYEEERRLSYNPAEREYGRRTGLKRFIAYDDRFDTVSKKLSELIKKVNKSKIKILDIAIGDGIYERMLSKELLQKCEIYAVDISKTQLQRVKDIVKEGKIVNLDDEKLPYKDDTFDIVIVSELLEHVFYPDNVLSEATRVLKKGGYFLLTYPNSGALQLRLSLLFTGGSPLLNYPGNKEHIRYFKKSDILEMIGREARLIEYQGLGSFLFAKWNFPMRFPTPRLIQRVTNYMFPSLSLGNMVVLQKQIVSQCYCLLPQ